jgi:hypothetical protein
LRANFPLDRQDLTKYVFLFTQLRTDIDLMEARKKRLSNKPTQSHGEAPLLAGPKRGIQPERAAKLVENYSGDRLSEVVFSVHLA